MSASINIQSVKERIPHPLQSVVDASRFIDLMHECLNEIDKISTLTGFGEIDLDDEDRATKTEFLLSISAYMANVQILNLLTTSYTQGVTTVSMSSLTNRQLAILVEVKTHKTNKEIGIAMGFSESTIHHEITKLLRHFNVSTRADLVLARDENEPN